MSAALQSYFEWPTLPFSVLLLMVSAYWLWMIVSGLDLDFLDLDLDFDGDPSVHTSVFDWGLVGLKWFNLGEVPLMVWMSAFALPAWLMSTTFDRGMTDPTFQEILTACLRNVGVALLVAKAATHPLKGRFKIVEPNTVQQLLGRECVVTTLEANEEFGQVRCSADGAPLILEVRTTGGTIAKGQPATIVDYSAEDRVYFVQKVEGSGSESQPMTPETIGD